MRGVLVLLTLVEFQEGMNWLSLEAKGKIELLVMLTARAMEEQVLWSSL